MDFLRDLGLEENLIYLVCKCTSSSSMNILSSGECTSEFFPSRSIRQGDPLSPYLFVICMERLSHLISLAMAPNLWKLVVLSRGGSPISHLYIIDDLFLFAEASLDQAAIIKSCLGIFVIALGRRLALRILEYAS